MKQFVTLKRLVVEFKKCPEYGNVSTEGIVEAIRERAGKFPGRYCKFRFDRGYAVASLQEKQRRGRYFELYIKPEELNKGRL